VFYLPNVGQDRFRLIRPDLSRVYARAECLQRVRCPADIQHFKEIQTQW
jgi:hypothetical protein